MYGASQAGPGQGPVITTSTGLPGADGASLSVLGEGDGERETCTNGGETKRGRLQGTGGGAIGK